jgi:transposase
MEQIKDFDKGRIIAYRECGKSNRWIAEKLSRCHTTIGRFLQKYDETGMISRVEGSGRKRKTTVRDDRLIVRSVKKKRTTSADDIKKELNLTLCEQTIRNRIHECGFSSCFTLKKNFVNERNRKLRLKWAKNYVSWTIDQWNNVLWSDESPFLLRYAGRIRVWRQRNERYKEFCLKGTVKHDIKINVWGCFTSSGVGDLKLIEGNMEQNQYKQILLHHMIPSISRLFPDPSNCIFQQDNDPKHTAKVVQNWIKNVRKIQVLPWPSQSPDLNPIENLWAILDKNLKNRQCRNEEELFQCLQHAWNALSPDMLSNLVSSMPQRCREIINNKGYPIKY